MKKTLLALSLLATTVLTLPVSCKKDKNPTPTNQGQQGNNNNNNNNNNGNNNNSGGYSNSTLYFRGTVNGAKTEWSQGSLSYRLKIRGGGSESACGNGTKEMMTAGFVLETFSQEDRFYISFTGCSDLDVTEDYFGNCDRGLDWLERETSFPVQSSDYAQGAYIKFKLPANGNTYSTDGGSGTVTFTRVELHGTGTYSDPRYVVTGTFSGTLVNPDDPADKIEIKDGTFRVYLGVCVLF